MSPFFPQPSKGLSPSSPSPATVQVHALSAGHFSLPEEQFVSPAAPAARSSVPSLCFLIQHLDNATGHTTRVVFDLGLRRDIDRYAAPIRRHVETRQPMTTDPDVVKSLKRGGLSPDDIDYVIYSHVHWDHIGEPHDFPRSTFVVGHGSRDLLSGASASLRGGHSFFEADLLDPARTVELSDPNKRRTRSGNHINGNGLANNKAANFSESWQSLGHLPAVLDLFGDGSLYVVDAPGHLPGHINLLARIDDGSESGSEIARANGSTNNGTSTGARWVYLAGDACHDRRILRGEKEIGEWHDVHGQVCCIHADRTKAEETIERVRRLEGEGVEVIFAHDVEWESDDRHRGRFFGAGK